MAPASQDRLSPVLEVATSSRVLQARRAVGLSEADTGVLLGRHFLTFRALAERCVGETSFEIGGILEGPAVARLVGNCAEEVEPFGSLVRAQPGISGALSSTLRDLRDAGVAPRDLPASSRALRELYERVESALERLKREHGLLDTVSVYQEAKRGAAPWARRLGLTRAEVHGATELVGSQGDLLDALAEAVPVRMVQPAPEDPHAREIRARWPWSFAAEPVQATAAGLSPGGRLEEDLLRVEPVEGGPREELEQIACTVLRRLDEGVAPNDIAIVGRTLEPYASWLPTVLESCGIRFSSSLAESALHHPGARSVLQLARVFLADLEREAVVELLNAPGFRGEAAGLGRAEMEGLPELAERLARQAGIAHGYTQWMWAFEHATDLVRAERVHPTQRELEYLRTIVERFAADAKRILEAPTWKRAVRGLLDAIEQWIPVVEREADQAVPSHGLLAREAACAALRGLESYDAVDESRSVRTPLTAQGILNAVEEALQRATVRPYAAEEGGILVLDAIQARGVPLRHLFLLGLNESLWPRLPEEDPFLPDDVRSGLRSELHRPVPVRGEAEADERFLFRLICSQASSSITALFHRIDASGRAAAPSPYLRELVTQSPNGSALREKLYGPSSDEPAAPSEPEPDLLPFRSALVEAAVHEGRDALRGLAEHGPDGLAEEVRRGLDHLQAIESFDASELSFDGVVRPEPSWDEGPVRPTQLEALAGCPLQVFFSYILRVPEFRESLPMELEARELGSLIHQALRDLYEALRDRGHLRPGTERSRAVAAAEAELDRILAEKGLFEPRAAGRHPGLIDGLRLQLRRSLRRFFEWDLERLLPTGVTELACEAAFEQEVEIGGDRIRLRGKIDRWLEMSTGELRISDYKTGSAPQRSVGRTAIRTGRALQLPLYVLQLGTERSAEFVEGEVLHVPLRPERLRVGSSDRTYPLKSTSIEEIRAEIEPPVATLLALLRSGHFPLRRSDQCDYCPYALACRRTHPPTVARIQGAAEFRAYHEMIGRPG